MARLTKEIHSLLTEDVLKYLQSKRINTIYAFIEKDMKILSNITKLSYKEISVIRKYILNEHPIVLVNGLEWYKAFLANGATIPTGICSLDELLTGGLTSACIYELCGLPNSGKTLMCLTITKNYVKQSSYKLIYIDTKRDFSSKKIIQLLNIKEAEVDMITTCLSQIILNQINTKYELINTLHNIKEELIKGTIKTQLIIIDSLPPLFYSNSDYERNNELMNHLANILRYLANQFHISFFITNIITSWKPAGNETVIETVGCGKYWSSIPQTTLKIEKFTENFQISVLKSFNGKIQDKSVKITL